MRRVFRLSREEAGILQAIFDRIGGSPQWTSRGAVDRLNERLRRTFGNCAHPDGEHLNGAINFVSRELEAQR